jgi:hypothetical protein
MNRDTNRICVACKLGHVIESTSKVYDPATGPLVNGPGSKDQY